MTQDALLGTPNAHLTEPKTGTASLLNFSPNSIRVFLVLTVSFRVRTIAVQAHHRPYPELWFGACTQSLVVFLGGDIPKQTDLVFLP